jgi:F420-dependent oxidoreductase-like protein
MRFSVWLQSTQAWDDILVAGRHAEQLGYEGLWVADHFMPYGAVDTATPFGGDKDGPMHECWSLLAGLAAAVPRVRLGSMVAGNTYRNPALLAKIAATVDHIAGGDRVVLGVGAGWQENEHTAYGFDLGSPKSRLDRLEEACAIWKGLLTDERTTFHGKRYTVLDAPLEPKPSAMPLLVGGAGEQRTMRIAAKYADEWNYWGAPEFMKAKNAVLDSRCEEIHRDPASLARSAVALVFMSDDQTWLDRMRSNAPERAHLIGTPAELVEQMHAYVAAGIDEFVMPDFTFGPIGPKLVSLELFMTEVVRPFHAG